jgi:hypothetical protein
LLACLLTCLLYFKQRFGVGKAIFSSFSLWFVLRLASSYSSSTPSKAARDLEDKRYKRQWPRTVLTPVLTLPRASRPTLRLRFPTIPDPGRPAMPPCHPSPTRSPPCRLASTLQTLSAARTPA